MGVLKRRSALGRLLKPVTGSRVLHRRSGLERLAERGAEMPSTVKSSLAEVHPPPIAVKSGLAAVGGLIGVTAGSAAVSARRRRSEASQ